MPIEFQLCEAVGEKELLDYSNTDDYIYEEKYDGENIMAIVLDEDVILLNRRGKICNIHFREVVDELKLISKFKGNFIVNGEMCSKDRKFNTLMRRAGTTKMNRIKQLETEIPIEFIVFDIIKCGEDVLIDKPLMERKTILNNLLGNGYNFKYVLLSSYVDKNGLSTLKENLQTNKKEGIVIKKKDSRYIGNDRKGWKKFKFWKEGELVVIKYEVNSKGIRCEDDKENAVQIAGSESEVVKQLIDKNGKAEILIQYLEKTLDNKYRFISFRGVKNEN